MPAIPMTADISTLNGGAPNIAPAADTPAAVTEGSVEFSADGDDFSVTPADAPAAEPAAEPAPTAKPVAQQPTKKPAEPTPTLDVKFEYDKKHPVEPAKPEQPAPAEVSSARDYSALHPDVAEIAKNFRNKQFAELTPKISEWHKKAQETDALRAQLAERPTEPQFAYEAPDAYLLDPQYRQTQQLAGAVDFEVSHWERQLELINSGEDWYELLRYDEKTGQPVYELRKAPADGKVDQRAAARVQRNLTESIQGQQIAQQRLASIQQQYASKYQDSARELAEVEAKLMPNIKEESLTPEEKQWFEAARNSAPARFKGHPMTRTLGKVYVAFMRLYNYTKQQEEENARLKKTQAASTLGGPRVTALSGRGPATKEEDEVVDFKQFD